MDGGSGRQGSPRALVARRAGAARGIGRLLGRVDLASVVGRTLEVAAAFERTPRRREVLASLARRARTRARALIAAIRAAGPLYEPSRFHEARIAAKKLRYVLELGRDLGRMPVEKEIEALRVAQDTLGELHDLQDLQRAVDAVAATTPSDRSTRLALATMSTALAAECRKRHAGFLQAEPAVTQPARRVLAMSVGMVRARPSRMNVKPGATLRPGGGADAVKGVLALSHPVTPSPRIGATTGRMTRSGPSPRKVRRECGKWSRGWRRWIRKSKTS